MRLKGHYSMQDNTFSPRNLAVLGGLLFFGLFLGEVVFPRHGGIFSQSTSTTIDSVEDIAERIRPVVTLDDILAYADSSATESRSRSPAQLYAAACQACHASGVAGAPKVGDSADWQSRLTQGLNAIVESAIAGKGAMPPNGGSTYSVEEIRAVVEYMLSESNI